MFSTPLAWKNLTHQPARLLVYLGGVTFAVALMFIQNGFRNALLDSTVTTVDRIEADLIIVSKARYALPIPESFPRERIDLARSVEGVDEVLPLYIEIALAVLKTPNQPGYPIRVLATDEPEKAFNMPGVQRQAAALRKPNAALLDTKTRAKYQLPVRSLAALKKEDAELTGEKIELLGYFDLGTDFAVEGNVIMTSENFEKYLPIRGAGAPLSVVDLGLVRVEEGTDPAVVQKRLRERFAGRDVQIFTKPEYTARERDFWQSATPIGSIFLVGMVMGFVVGVIICYQIIYTCVDDYLPEFATLVAMGYSARYFIGVILWTSIYLSVLGFIPGLAISWGLFFIIEQATGLPMDLTILRIITIYFLTLGMCVLSGMFTVRKVLSVDPAELF